MWSVNGTKNSDAHPLDVHRWRAMLNCREKVLDGLGKGLDCLGFSSKAARHSSQARCLHCTGKLWSSSR